MFLRDILFPNEPSFDFNNLSVSNPSRQLLECCDIEQALNNQNFIKLFSIIFVIVLKKYGIENGIFAKSEYWEDYFFPLYFRIHNKKNNNSSYDSSYDN